MKRKDYQPGPAGQARATRDGDRWTLIFERHLQHPPDRVWQALTDPAELKAWAPFDPDRDLGRTGDATLSMAGAETPQPMAATVRQAERPRLLEYSWGKDLIRWELEPSGPGTRLTLRHTMEDGSWLPKVAAGWQICLDVADRHLSGTPVGRIVAGEAMDHGWQRLHDEFAERLELPLIPA